MSDKGHKKDKEEKKKEDKEEKKNKEDKKGVLPFPPLAPDHDLAMTQIIFYGFIYIFICFTFGSLANCQQYSISRLCFFFFLSLHSSPKLDLIQLTAPNHLFLNSLWMRRRRRTRNLHVSRSTSPRPLPLPPLVLWMGCNFLLGPMTLTLSLLRESLSSLAPSARALSHITLRLSPPLSKVRRLSWRNT